MYPPPVGSYRVVAGKMSLNTMIDPARLVWSDKVVGKTIAAVCESIEIAGMTMFVFTDDTYVLLETKRG